MKKVAMFQSNYIPWKGYFDIIHDVDVFVFYDDVQYTTRDWRNRNIIKPKNGLTWLTVPVVNNNLREKKIFEVEIDNSTNWAQKHYKSITLSYSKAPYFKENMELLERIYMAQTWTNLAEMNRYITRLISEYLGIKAEFINLEDLNVAGDKNGERIIKVCERLNCNHVINSPKASAFINQDLFDESGVKIEYKNYEYPEYRQLNRPFDHHVSIIDLLLNTGPDASHYIWGWRNGQ